MWQGWQALDPTYREDTFSMPVAVIAIMNMAMHVKIKIAFFIFAPYDDVISIALVNAIIKLAYLEKQR